MFVAVKRRRRRLGVVGSNKPPLGAEADRGLSVVAAGTLLLGLGVGSRLLGVVVSRKVLVRGRLPVTEASER
jgi:hypothetical protein